MTKHLYIHWPFCSSKCHYCDFVAFEQHEDYQQAYHQTLCKEIMTFANQSKSLDTIFIGGGTPSLYPLAWMAELFALLKTKFSFDKIKEITIETNPADIDEERLEAWRELGINRISMGVQSLNDDVLLKLNRRQRMQDVTKAMRSVPKYFDNISIDLILGLPEISQQAWMDTINLVTTWPISHISIYFLMVHEKTPLYFKVQQGDVTLADDESLVPLYEQTVRLLKQHGFDQYEISNFAKPGRESVHNQAYWDRKPYKGFGVGASSFDGISRFTNDNNLVRYMKSGNHEPCVVPATQEKLTGRQELLELLMLSLRQKKGLNLQRVLYFLNEHEITTFKKNLESLIQAGFIDEQENTIRLTLKGMAMENEVIVRLL